MATDRRPPSKHANRRQGDGPLEAARVHIARAANADIAVGERLPDERALLAAGLDGGSEALARLLLWRRSFLFVGLVVLVPTLLFETITTIMALADPDVGGMPINKDNLGVLGGLRFLVLCLNITLAIGVLLALRRWADWERSRRVLFWTWLVSFVAPFAVALFPMRALGTGPTAFLWGLIGALEYVTQLAPKAVSLIPGVLRAAVTTKVLFPGSATPGWLVILAAPILSLLLFVVLIVPYQLSGSPFIVIAILALSLAPLSLWRAGKALTRPASHEDALATVRHTRRLSLILNGVGALFLLVGLLDGGLNLGVFDVLKVLLSVVANVVILSVIAMDLMVRTLARAHIEHLALSSHETNLAHVEAMSAFAAAASITTTPTATATVTAREDTPGPPTPP